MGKVIRNLGVFQALWFLVVIGGDAFAVFAFGWALYHWVSYSDTRERLLLPIYAAIGLIFDGALTAVGVLTFSSNTTLLPIWLIALRSIFPTTLNHGLNLCRVAHSGLKRLCRSSPRRLWIYDTRHLSLCQSLDCSNHSGRNAKSLPQVSVVSDRRDLGSGRHCRQQFRTAQHKCRSALCCRNRLLADRAH